MTHTHTMRRMFMTFVISALCASVTFAQYCTPIYTTGTAEGDFIDGVVVADLSNTSSGAAITGIGYSDYTGLTANVTMGDTYTMTCTNNPTWSQTYTAWIDYNHDNVFDVSEVIGNLSLAGGGSGSFSFTVPTGLTPGNTGMRVRCIYPSGLGTPLDPCASTSFGEAEDYTLNLMGGLTNDVAVIDITNPTTGPGLGLEDVIVTVENFGSSDASGFTVSYQVDGGLVTAGFFPGTLPAFSTASWTAPEGWDFSAEGCYEITAWTTLAGDENPGNDSYTETVCHTGAVAGNGAYYILSNTTGGEPWFTVNNSNAMTAVFGTEGVGWTRDYFETMDVGSVFGPDNCFVFLEGSDGHAIELENFLIANISAIESWVSSGGKLLLNAAPNEGDGMSFGFGGTSLFYAYFTSDATADAGAVGHPIFNGPFLPAGTYYTGTSFGHATVTGTGLTNLMVDAFSPSNVVLAEKTWGSGTVLFGGMTTDNWHSPTPNASNLRANIISYLACDVALCPAPIGLGADAITSTSAHLSWDPSDNSGGYHLSVYTLDEVEVLKKKVLGGLTDWTVTGLTPGTDYGFHVRSICVADGIKSVISDHYYFSTPARIGEIENDQIAMYPNPSNGVFTLELNNYEGNNFEVNITNALGQIVYTTMIDVTNNNYTQTIDLGNAAAGIYQVTLKNASTTMNYAISIND